MTPLEWKWYFQRDHWKFGFGLLFEYDLIGFRIGPFSFGWEKA